MDCEKYISKQWSNRQRLETLEGCSCNSSTDLMLVFLNPAGTVSALKSKINTKRSNSQPCVYSQGHTPNHSLRTWGKQSHFQEPGDVETAAGRVAPSHLPGGCPGSCRGGRSGPSAGTLSSPAGATQGVTGGNGLSLPTEKQLGKPK